MNTSPRPGSGRPSGVPYPPSTPFHRDDLPDRGQPGAPASWGLRAAARIIDFVIVLLPVNALGALVGQTEDGRFEAPFWVLLLFPVLFVAYETILISRTGQTLGKYLCRIKVVEWSTGEVPTPKEAFFRAMVPGIWLFLYLLGGVLALLIFVPGLVYLTSLADTMYRGVHDKAANTIVLADPRGRRAAD